MRKLIEFKIEVGDANYVKPDEYFGELSADGTTITSIKRRADDLSLQTITSTPLDIEDNKAATANATTFVVNPTSGKDAMKKATVTIPLEEGAATKSIAALEAGTLVIEPSEGKLGLSKVTITFTE